MGAGFLLAGCMAPAQQSSTSAAPSQGASQLMMEMGVSAFLHACLDNLPDFAGTPQALEAMSFIQQEDAWVGGGGSVVFSLPQANGRTGCVASIAQTDVPTVGIYLADGLEQIAPDTVVSFSRDGQARRFVSQSENFTIILRQLTEGYVTLIADGRAQG